MKKTISGVLLALTAVFALGAFTGCGKSSSKGQIRFYCWNDEFKTRLNDCYDKVDKAEGTTTTLKDGIVIKWVQSPNQSGVYQNSLDVALDNGLVDMFCFEADYATKYVKSNYVAKMADLGLTKDGALKNQYKYTQDIVTNQNGDIVGSSWQATPGIIAYKEDVANSIWDGVTLEQMTDKFSTADKFKAAAAEAAAKTVTYHPYQHNADGSVKKDDNGNILYEDTEVTTKVSMMLGPDDWFRTYSNNISKKMWDGDKITVDKQLFQWVADTKEYLDAGYIHSAAAGFGLWGADWGPAQGEMYNIAVFSCPWFTDFCLNGNVTPDKTTGSLGYKATAGYKSWFWGGTWLTATKAAAENKEIKDDVADIIKKMTTDTAVLKKIALEKGDFTNDKPAMTELAGSAEGNSKLFGGQNVIAIYAASVESADLSKASDFDQQICENMQNAYRSYFQGSVTADKAWSNFVEALGQATSVDEAKIIKGE